MKINSVYVKRFRFYEDDPQLALAVQLRKIEVKAQNVLKFASQYSKIATRNQSMNSLLALR